MKFNRQAGRNLNQHPRHSLGDSVTTPAEKGCEALAAPGEPAAPTRVLSFPFLYLFGLRSATVQRIAGIALPA